MFKRGIRPIRIGRPLVGVIVAYAVAVQSLFIALGGFALGGPSDGTGPAFELCLHDSQTTPEIPVGIPGQHNCNHCIFCFAGPLHALAAPPAALYRAVDAEFTGIAWPSERQTGPRLPAYSIAHPRGPPLRA